MYLANHHSDRESHTPLASSTKGSAHDSIDGMVSVGVRHDGSVVLGTHVGLNTLPVGVSSCIDVLSGIVGANKGHGLVVGVGVGVEVMIKRICARVGHRRRTP